MITVTSHTKARFWLLRTMFANRPLSRLQGNLKPVVRASWDKNVLWITSQNPVNFRSVDKKTVVFEVPEPFCPIP